MAYSKQQEFVAADIELAAIARALSHPGRVAILRMLAKRDCVCGEIVSDLPLAQATVSQHLKELKKVGLIKGTIQGPAICYCLNRKTITKISALLDKFWDSLES